MLLSFLYVLLFFCQYGSAIKLSSSPLDLSGFNNGNVNIGVLSLNWTLSRDDPPNLKLVFCDRNQTKVLSTLDTSNSSIGSFKAPPSLLSDGVTVAAVPGNVSNSTDLPALLYTHATNLPVIDFKNTTLDTLEAIDIPVINPSPVESAMPTSSEPPLQPPLSAKPEQASATADIENKVDAFSDKSPQSSDPNVPVEMPVAQPTGSAIVQGCTQDRCSTNTRSAPTQSPQNSMTPSLLSATDTFMDTARSTASLSSLPNGDGQDPDTPSKNVTKAVDMAPPIIISVVIVATMSLVVLVVLLRRFCTRGSVYRSLNASPPRDNDDNHSPNMDDLEKATSAPPTERDQRDKQRTRKFKGMTWKRISPFELGRGKSNRKRSWVSWRSGAQDDEGSLPQFDSDALVSRRISKEPPEQVPTVTSQTENAYLRVEVEDVESEDAGEERIDAKEFESIVETSGVAMTPRWPGRSSMYSGVSSADTARASMISNFGTDYTDYKDEDGTYTQPPTLSIPVLYRKKAGGLTPSAASSPILTSPVGGLGHSPVLLRMDPDAIMSPGAESVDSLRLEVQQLREGIRRLVDHQESGWANPGYREPTYEERPPDYGASIVNVRL